MASLGVTRDHPVFYHENEPIAAIADPPHLLKSTRNCLLNYRISSSRGTASWDDLVALFEEDKKGDFRLCPKLSNRHFCFKAYGSKMRVKWAAQVHIFSEKKFILARSQQNLGNTF